MQIEGGKALQTFQEYFCVTRRRKKRTLKMHKDLNITFNVKNLPYMVKPFKFVIQNKLSL